MTQKRYILITKPCIDPINLIYSLYHSNFGNTIYFSIKSCVAIFFLSPLPIIFVFIRHISGMLANSYLQTAKLLILKTTKRSSVVGA